MKSATAFYFFWWGEVPVYNNHHNIYSTYHGHCYKPHLIIESTTNSVFTSFFFLFFIQVKILYIFLPLPQSKYLRKFLLKVNFFSYRFLLIIYFINVDFQQRLSNYTHLILITDKGLWNILWCVIVKTQINRSLSLITF